MRKIIYPKCPYCKSEFQTEYFDYNSQSLVDLAIGNRSSDVTIRCKNCDNKYMVSCTTKFNARKLK